MPLRVPVSWLKEYVDVDASPEELADRLTFSGIELEGMETVGVADENVVVGEVLEVAPHPNADRLSLCRVSDGTETVDVVCGAPNVTQGMKAPFAKVGAVLPGDFKVKKAKIRGQVSMGMLCAEDELGLSDDHDGLMVMAPDTETGKPFREIIPPETVLVLEITWNRPDCLSIIGIAREIAALYGLPLKTPEVKLPETGKPIEEFASVRIDDPLGCPRYTARVLSDAELRPSPLWMQRRLANCGVRPINNIVDVTNYVMLECGQPLHAFDHKLLDDRQIVVRRAGAGEKMATLDDVERAITPEMVVIADAHKPVALAGVMGGAGSEIREDTQTVLLESAAFDAPSIHATATSLGLTTESSHRFERGVDVDNVEWASRRAAALMVKLAGATPATGVIDIYPGKREPVTLRCGYQKARDRIGVAIPDEEIKSVFERLQIPVASEDGEGCTVTVPCFRLDLTIEEDLIEEVARMHGLEGIPSKVPEARVVPDADDIPTRRVSRCRHHLLGLGLTEAMHYSFVSAKLLDRFGTDAMERRVVLPNPVSADHAVMRDSLLPQMVETLGRNIARQVPEAALFEVGRIFQQHKKGKIQESDALCIGLMGKVGRGSLDRQRPVQPEEMFLWLKGILESLADAQNLPAPELAASDHPAFEKGWCVEVTIGGKRAGLMGLVKKDIAEEWRCHEPLGICHLYLETVINQSLNTDQLDPLPAFPGATRDMAIVVPESVQHGEILDVVRRAAPPELTRIELFDIYKGERVGEGAKSLAYSLVYRSLERTLTDEEANAFHDSIKDALRRELKADIREA